MSHTHNIEVIYDFKRNDGEPCTKADLKAVINAPALDTYWKYGKEFNDCIDSIQDDAPVLACGVVNCHALVTITTDDTDEDATAERVAESVIMPELEGYTATFAGVIPVYL
jgi:hypothetical protein